MLRYILLTVVILSVCLACSRQRSPRENSIGSDGSVDPSLNQNSEGQVHHPHNQNKSKRYSGPFDVPVLTEPNTGVPDTALQSLSGYSFGIQDGRKLELNALSSEIIMLQEQPARLRSLGDAVSRWAMEPGASGGGKGGSGSLWVWW